MVSHLVPYEILLTIYNSHVLLYFDYCSAVWRNGRKGVSDILQKWQNTAARVVNLSNYNCQSSELLNRLMWDYLEITKLKQLAVLMYKTISKSTRKYLITIFENKNSVLWEIESIMFMSKNHILMQIKSAFIIKWRLPLYLYICFWKLFTGHCKNIYQWSDTVFKQR